MWALMLSKVDGVVNYNWVHLAKGTLVRVKNGKADWHEKCNNPIIMFAYWTETPRTVTRQVQGVNNLQAQAEARAEAKARSDSQSKVVNLIKIVVPPTPDAPVSEEPVYACTNMRVLNVPNWLRSGRRNRDLYKKITQTSQCSDLWWHCCRSRNGWLYNLQK